MTNHIREQVRMELARRMLSQTELAKRTGRGRQAVNAAIHGRLGEVNETWRLILDELGLELTLVPKKEV